MARVDFRVVGERGEDLVESPVHLRGGAFEEFAAAANEKGVSCKDCAFRWGFGCIFEVVADAVLGVARRVEGGDGDVFPDWELRGVGWSFGDGLAVLAADDGGGGGELFEHLVVAAGVVPVVVSVEYGG